MSRAAGAPRPMTGYGREAVDSAGGDVPRIRFVYFNIKARGELIRLILHAAGAQFDDVRVENNSALAGIKENTPFHTLPLLDYDGLQLGQTMSIARFLALELGLRGQSDYEQALVDSVAETADDLLSDYLSVIFNADKHSKKDNSKKNFVDNILPTALRRFDNFQRAHSGEYGYIVGLEMTYADLAVYNVLDQVSSSGLVEQDYYQRFRYTSELRKRIMTHGGLMRYMNNRPKTSV